MKAFIFRKTKYIFLALGILWQIAVCAQDQRLADSLKVIYDKGNLKDSTRLELLRLLSFNEVKDLDLSLKYAEELINLSQKTGNNIYLRRGYFQKGNKKRLSGDLKEAMDAYIKSAEIARQEKNKTAEGNTYGAIADIYSMSNNHSNARLYYKKAIDLLRESNDSIPLASAILNAGDEFRISEVFDTALIYFEEAGRIFEQKNYLIGKAYCIGNIGMIYASTGDNKLAEVKITEAIQILEEMEDYYPICSYLISMADIYNEKGEQQAALSYAQKSLELATKYRLKEQIRDANLKLSELYEQIGIPAESFKYYKNYIVYRDSLNNISTVQSMANLRTDFEISQKQLEVDRLNRQKENQRWGLISTAGVLLAALLLLSMLYRNIRNKQKANALLREQKKKIESALADLKATQAQLIHAEKMASLGELTAGIAHEIQNPLNFVNNFSEVSAELLEEVKEELAKNNLDEANEIIGDLIQNLQKIKQHGNRAGLIVKGMLLHTRGNSGEKELTDINLLCKEYLRLSYHGFRAKDKDFNAEYKLEADEKLPKTAVVPQDIGRVLLNLLNNAFYAVNEKVKKNKNSFNPLVVVQTSKTEKGVEIRVIDNGTGIPDNVREKIFQPFYTTKPTGQGTGLGLSLSFDILKANGGALAVNSTEGEGSEFIVLLET